MFWGLIIEPNKRYTQTVEKSFHVSMASLDFSTAIDDKVVQVMLCYDGRNYLLCTLSRLSNWQVPLDLNFQEGTKIAFTCNGNAHVHLTGYLIPDENLDYNELEEEEEEEEDDDEQVSLLAGKQIKRKSVAPLKDNRKVKRVNHGDFINNKTETESDDNDSDEGTDEDEEDLTLNSTTDVVKEDNDDSEDDDADDNDDDDDDDDDDAEEEEDDEDSEIEEVEKEKKVTKSPSPDKKNKQIQQQQPQKQQKKKQDKQKIVNGKEVTKQEQQSKKDKKNKNEQQQSQQNQQEPKKRVIEGGIQVEDIKLGNGAPAKAGKFVSVYYTGRLKNGKKFDSTTQGEGFKFRLGRGEVIKGWDAGIAGMKIGGKRRIVIPPALAYGARGSPPVIPPNSALIFDIELKNVY